MAIIYRCAGSKRGVCDYESDRPWRSRCPQCGHFYDCLQKGSEDGPASSSLATLGLKDKIYHPVGIAPFDRVIGGGLVNGAPYVISGPNGCGKSTLLLTVAHSYATETRKVLYTSGEENAEDVAAIAKRIDKLSEHIDVKGMFGDIYEVTERAEEIHAKLLIVDSINTAYCDDCKGDEGSPAQMKAVANYLTAWCKRKKTPAIIVAHVDKAGDMSGPEAVKHLVDTVLELDPAPEVDENDEIKPLTKDRVVFSVAKNRHGESHLFEHFDRKEDGIVWIRKRSRLEIVRDE